MTDSHKKLLEMAGFSPADIETDLPQWLNTAERLGLTGGDVRLALESWLPEQWDLGLTGVRRVLGVLLKELMALCNPVDGTGRKPARLYTALPFPPAIPLALQLAGGKSLLVAAPDVLLNMALGAIFHHRPSWLEPHANSHLPGYGCQRCGLNLIRVAALAGGLVPPADATWTAGFFCDEAPKVDEYLECLGAAGRNSIVCRLPQDAGNHMSSTDQADRKAYLKSQLRFGLDSIERALHLNVDDELLQAGISRWQSYAFKLGSLNSLMQRSDPPPLGGFESALFALPLIMPFSTGLDEMESALETCLDEARQRCAHGRGAVAKGSPRVLIYQIPYSQPRFSRLFESCGMALTGSAATAMHRPLSITSPDRDPLGFLSEAYLHDPTLMGLNSEADAVCNLVKRFRPDGLVTGLFDFDRRLGMHQPLLARIVRERTDCPALYLEGDLWGQREHPREQLRERLESFRSVILQTRNMNQSFSELKGKIPRWGICSPA